MPTKEQVEAVTDRIVRSNARSESKITREQVRAEVVRQAQRHEHQNSKPR